MTPAIRAYLRQIGARGNEAMRGTQMAKERARKAGIASGEARRAKAKKENNK